MTVSATKAQVILVLNMFTDNLTSQLGFIQHAYDLGMTLAGVELGNEFYVNRPDFIAKFADGTQYGETCTTWIKAIQKQFPALPIAVVGSPAKKASKPRTVNWNKSLFAAVQGLRPGIDGVTIHQYDASGAHYTAGGGLTKQDVTAMLQTPFEVQAELKAKIATEVPKDISVWITEYNLKYNIDIPDIPAFGTWAHSMYIAVESTLFLQVPEIAAGRACKHSLFSKAQNGALFQDEKSFNFKMSPDPSLPTKAYALSGPGLVLSLLGNSTFGMNSATALSFSSVGGTSLGDTSCATFLASHCKGKQGEACLHCLHLNRAELPASCHPGQARKQCISPPAPPTSPTSVIGVAFEGSNEGPKAFVVNLSDRSIEVDLPQGKYSRFLQHHLEDATKAINDAKSQVTATAGATDASGKATLAPYSVTNFFE